MVAKAAAALDLGILSTTNEDILGKVEQKLKGKTDDILAGYMSRIEKAHKEAAEIRDPVKRAEKLNLLNAKFGTVRSDMETDRTDMADVVLGFAEFAKQLDMQIEGLFDQTPAQTARIKAAETRVAEATAEMEKAPNRATFWGMRDPVAAAKEELEKAESELIEVKAEVARDINKRAKEARMDESLARLLSFGERAYAALVEGHRILLARTKAIQIDKEKSFEIAKKTKDMIGELDKNITNLEGQRDSARDVLDHASEQDPNYLELKQDLARIESELQTAAADRTALLMVSREETINAQEYVGYERTAISMTGDAKGLAAAQQVKNRNIAQKRTHYIETMEQLKKIEMSTEVLKTGNEADKRLLDTILSAGAATTNARQGFMKEQPQRLSDVLARLEEQDEQMLHAAGIDQATRDDFAKRFGLGGAGTPAA